MHAEVTETGQSQHQLDAQPFTFNLPISLWAEVFKNFDQLHELRSLALVCRAWQQLCSSGTWPSVRQCTPQAHHASLLPALRQLAACPNLTSLDLSLCPALPQAWLHECSIPSLQALNLDGNGQVTAPLPPPLAAHLTALNISGTAVALWGPEQPWAAALTTLSHLTANRLQRQPRSVPLASTLFRQLMRGNTRLHALSLASNPALTSRHLLPAWAPAPHPSPAASLGSLCLAGCESFGDGHWAPPTCPRLTHLDLSATGISDTQLRSIPLSPALHHLDLGGCARVTGQGLLALLPLLASPVCRLRGLLLGNMPRVDEGRLGQLLGTWAANVRWQVSTGQVTAPVVVSVDLAGCGKVTDAVLASFLPTGDEAGATPPGLPVDPQDQHHHHHESHHHPRNGCEPNSRPPPDPSQRLSAVAARRHRGACGARGADLVIGAAGSALAALYSAASGGQAAEAPDLAARLEAALQLEPVADGTRWQGRPPGLQPAPASLVLPVRAVAGGGHPPAAATTAAAAAITAAADADADAAALECLPHSPEARSAGSRVDGCAPCPEGSSCQHPSARAPAEVAAGSWPHRRQAVAPPRPQPDPDPHARTRPLSAPKASAGPTANDPRPCCPPQHPPPAPLQLGTLLLSGTAITTLAPLATAGLLAHTHTLDLSHVEAFRIPTPPTAPTPPPLTLALPHPAPALRSLTLDACFLGDATTHHLAPRCPHLTALSLIGCRGLTNEGLQCFVAACPALALLAVGGMSPLWQEATALAGLTSLTELRLVRRTATLDRDLVPLLRANPRLQVLTLAGCSSITDAALAFVPKGLRALTLTCCEDVEGRTVATLRRLRLLRISSCPRFSPVAVASAAVSCTRLAVLVLPGHLPRSCVPLQAPGGHLDGLRILGGRTGQHGGGYL